MSAIKTVLIVDDEEKIVSVLRSYLESAGYQVAAAGDGAGALALFESRSPVLVLLDLMLPDMPGESVLHAIRMKSNVPVIMLTAKSAEESILRGLGAGADDYIVKPFSPRQVLARVEAVLRRAAGSDAPAVLSFPGGLVIDMERRAVIKNGAEAPLTPNEFAIVAALAARPAKVFTREELIARALGDEFDGYPRIIDTHVKNIRQKLEDNPREPRYILTAFGVGYRFGGGAHED